MKTFLVIVLILSSLVSCKKEIPAYNVRISFGNVSGKVIFTGEQGQGEFVFTPESNRLRLPVEGTYKVCLEYVGECDGMMRNEMEQVVVAKDDQCKVGHSIREFYYVHSNCE